MKLLTSPYLLLERLVNRGVRRLPEIANTPYIILEMLINRGVRSLPRKFNTLITNSKEASKKRVGSLYEIANVLLGSAVYVKLLTFSHLILD